MNGLRHSEQVAREILNERAQQVAREGFSVENDDTYELGELAMAAAAYAVSDKMRRDPEKCELHMLLWPWRLVWWKPTDRRRDLVKAGALIVAEIERLDRKSARREPLKNPPVKPV